MAILNAESHFAAANYYVVLFHSFNRHIEYQLKKVPTFVNKDFCSIISYKPKRPVHCTEEAILLLG